MTNFKVEFLISPWLLLLLIPALFLTFFPYFRMAKRYRKTRNRIVSIVLHVIIMVLCISVLSGMKFSYDMRNEKNELVILVDTSYSNDDEEARAEKANFIYNVVEANDNISKIAVVKFGYDQETVLAMGDYDADTVLDRLDFSDDPDTTATDIRAALEYAWNPTTKSSAEGLISNEDTAKTAKILLISDGLQTDQDALTLVRAINSDGIRVDTVQFSSEFRDEARIVGVTFPEQNLAVSENFDMEIAIQSDFQGSIVVDGTDDDGSAQKDLPSQTVNVISGMNTVRFSYAFNTPGHHELSFRITSEDDTISENNTYYAYYDLIEFNKVLVIERYDDESEQLVPILDKKADESNYYDVTVARFSDFDSIPKSVEEMRAYDQIILVNISHEDMGQIDVAFELNLNNYAYTYGGGVLTIGGQERDSSGQVVMETVDGQSVPKPHSYDHEDMKDSTYQRMLPVEAIDYTPPIAIAIILDQSGSMAQGGTSAGTPLEVAGAGALACVDALNQRDWVGIMGLRESYTTALDMTPCTQKNRIRAAINEATKEANGSTMYYPALDRACLALSSLTSVERRHIILISDGGHYDFFDTNDEGALSWKSIFERSSNADITVSVVQIGDAAEPTADIQSLCDFTGGRAYCVPFNKIDQLPQMMLEEIEMPEVSGVNASEKYSPEINTRTSITGTDVTQEMLNEITMTGFFGSRAKSGGEVVVPLNAKFVPLYAQWEYGRGMVGSFMCDLNGYWSQEFLDSKEAGVPIINNIVSALMPKTNIRAQALNAEFTEDNYRTQVSVFGEIELGKKLVAVVEAPAEEGSFEVPPPTVFDLSKETAGGNRFTFENKVPGIHKVTILRVSSDLDIGTVTSVDDITDYDAILESYRVFGYSEEYNVFRDPATEGAELLQRIAEYGDGTFLDPRDVETVYDGFEDLHKEWDPRLAFIIISLILFLLDVAVRKFKWKWPHEVLRDRKARRAMARD